MHNEQVFTPEHIVNRMLDEAGYKGDSIRKRHIIDNSCGNGAILKIVVGRYISVCAMSGLQKEETARELETYIHGIELDRNLAIETITTLSKIAASYSIYGVNWDIVAGGNAMDYRSYDGKMDYVIGNPPYCNIHHISERDREKVKSYKFANGGMTDLYLVFFEIGINMLKENGTLVYITPNSWLTSVAGKNFRDYLYESQTLLSIIQYGNEKVFEGVNTYTCITSLSKRQTGNRTFTLYKRAEKSMPYTAEDRFVKTEENLDDCMIDGKIYLTGKATLDTLRNISTVGKIKDKCRIRVKNGFATLNDELFKISYQDAAMFGFNENVIPTIKASNGESHYFFYPYDADGKPMQLKEIDHVLVSYMEERAKNMGVDTSNPLWYLYGRTQAINDVPFDKIAVNNLIRDTKDIRISPLYGKNGVYSGYYIPLYSYCVGRKQKIIDAITCQEFVNYVKAVGKYKNGGYYTFSSKELENWLNFSIDGTIYKK